MFRVYVRGFGAKEMARFEKNMRRMTIKGMEEVAKRLTDQLIMRVPVWRGNLKNSIRVKRIKRSAVGITMNFYGPLLEKGHRITRVVPYLKVWAREKLPSPERWLKLVAQYGAYVSPERPEFGRPFIRPSIEFIAGQIDFIMIKNLRKVRG